MSQSAMLHINPPIDAQTNTTYHTFSPIKIPYLFIKKKNYHTYVKNMYYITKK
jgi:hypothetical protein